MCIAIGLDLDGRKDVLGMWVGENESARFWATILNGLRNRGVEDIFIACTDNLTGFDTAIHAVFPETEIQNGMIHQLRNSSKYVSYKDLKALMSDLKAVYAAGDGFIDPHTADGIKVARELRLEGETIVCLETALATKFDATVHEALGSEVQIPRPANLAGLEDLPQHVTEVANDVAVVKDIIRAAVKI